MAVTKTPDEENNAIQELYKELGSEYAHLDREVGTPLTLFPARADMLLLF